MEKKKPSNKKAKTTRKTKEAKVKTVEKPKSIDWDSLPNYLTIVGVKGKSLVVGKEYVVTKEIAQILVKNGKAELK